MSPKKGGKRPGNRRRTNHRIAWVIAAVLLVGAAGYLAAVARTGQSGGWETVEQVLGSPDAPVTVTSYVDFACPHCGTFALEMEPELVDRYVEAGQVRLVYRPMAFLGPGSLLAAQVAALVSEQGSDLFWRFHARVFEELHAKGPRFTREGLVALAAEVGADTAAIEAGLDQGRYRDVLGKVRRLAIEQEGVRVTPTVFVGDHKFEGVPQRAELFALIDRMLAEASS